MSAELITTSEANRLCELERIIQKGKDTFVEVGTALSEIRDSRIYRATFKTFEEYCQNRWDFSRQYVNKIISAAEVVSKMETTVSKPTSERQVRELAKAPEEDRPAAWERAQEIAKEEGKQKPAARHVEAAVMEVMPKEEPETVVVDGTTPTAAEEAERDSANLWLLKSTWKKTTKRDKSAFMNWTNNN